eukprot:FR736537.1.p1 GENE.FR736537.1~~FR736537.1.p1  ORF type:complete len:211 (+),score=19.43 FR736537.1:112-744(+)
MEDSVITHKQREVLFRQWGYFWDLDLPVLLEKSPSNIIISRYLDAIWSGSAPAAADSGWSQAKHVHFVFITRHPIANALAHQVWQICQDMTLFELVKHWATLHERLQDDLEHLGATYTLLKYEEFVVDPDSNLRHIYKAVGLDASRANRTIQVEQGTNDKYRKKYCEKISDPQEMAAHEELVERLGADVASHGYDLAGWANCADYELARQ